MEKESIVSNDTQSGNKRREQGILTNCKTLKGDIDLMVECGMDVKLECSNHLMKYVVDRFGEKAKNEIATEDTFYAYTEVALSPNFYSWLFKFAGEISLLSPAKARDEYLAKAKKVIDNSSSDR